MEIAYSKQALKDIKTLNEPAKSRIKKAIEELPFGDVLKLEGYTTYYRLRVGGYRVIFDHPQKLYIVILTIAPRGAVYRRF